MMNQFCCCLFGRARVQVDDIQHGYSNNLTHDIAASVCLSRNSHIVAFSYCKGFDICKYKPAAWYCIKVEFDFPNHRYRVRVTKPITEATSGPINTADHMDETAAAATGRVSDRPDDAAAECLGESDWIQFWDPTLNFLSHVYLFQHSKGSCPHDFLRIFSRRAGFLS